MRRSNVMPAAAAALVLSRSREQVVRLLQRAMLEGELRGGRWFVTCDSVERLKQSERMAVTDDLAGTGQ